MTVRHLAAAALAAAALTVTAAPASATCYVGNVDICDKPTDPYTDPVTEPVQREVSGVIGNPALEPAWGAVGTVSRIVVDVYVDVLCLAGLSSSC